MTIRYAIRSPVRAGIRSTLGAGGGVLSPLARLFINGENGFLFEDFSDTTRLFQQSYGGGNPATDADAVALMLERSTWRDKTTSALLASQLELASNPGGPFANTTGYTGFNATLSVVSGELQLVSSASAGRAMLALPTTVGALYYVVVPVASSDDPGVVLQASNNADGASAFASNAPLSGAGQRELFFVATATTTYLALRVTNSGTTTRFTRVSVRKVPGNHAIQTANTSYRAGWYGNSGQSYLGYDGVDDRQITPFIPTAALTFAAAFRATKAVANTYVMGGGASTGNKRAQIGINPSGYIIVGWGISETGDTVDRSGQDTAVVVTGDPSGRSVYINGNLIGFAAASAAPDGTGGGFSLGGYNNAGTQGGFLNGRLYAAMAMNRRASTDEVSIITEQLQARF